MKQLSKENESLKPLLGIEKLNDVEEQCREIELDNESKVKTENDILDDNNNLLTEEEEMGEDSLQKAETRK